MAGDGVAARYGGRVGPWVGAFLLLHVIVVCAVKTSKGISEEVLWISHVSLALAALGLIGRSSFLVALALISVLVPHTIWLVDCVVGFGLGQFPLGISRYLLQADLWDWIATAHHFYLVPVLGYFVIRGRQFPVAAIPTAMVLYVVLTICCRLMLSRSSNVNSSYAVIPLVDHPAVYWVNGLPMPAFLVFLNTWVSLTMVLPAGILLRRLINSRMHGRCVEISRDP